MIFYFLWADSNDYAKLLTETSKEYLLSNPFIWSHRNNILQAQKYHIYRKYTENMSEKTVKVQLRRYNIRRLFTVYTVCHRPSRLKHIIRYQIDSFKSYCKCGEE